MTTVKCSAAVSVTVKKALSSTNENSSEFLYYIVKESYEFKGKQENVSVFFSR